jgi:hypothetical protein
MEAGSSERRPHRKPTNWTARVLAPLALVGVVVAVVVIVGGSLGSSDEDGDGSKRGGDGNATTTSGCRPAADNAVKAGYFVIEAGEDLSVVADKTCIPLDRLENLNPNLDPQLIPIGGCVDLRKDGCKALAAQG